MIDSIHFFFITLKYRFHFCFLPVAIKIIPSIKRTIPTGRLITNSTTPDNKKLIAAITHSAIPIINFTLSTFGLSTS